MNDTLEVLELEILEYECKKKSVTLLKFDKRYIVFFVIDI